MSKHSLRNWIAKCECGGRIMKVSDSCYTGDGKPELYYGGWCTKCKKSVGIRKPEVKTNP